MRERTGQEKPVLNSYETETETETAAFFLLFFFNVCVLCGVMLFCFALCCVVLFWVVLMCGNVVRLWFSVVV